MMLVALLGSGLNLFSIHRLRSLRGRASSQWRVGPVPVNKKRAENIQIALAITSIALAALEEIFHVRLNGI